MSELLLAAAVLACPIGMGAMMWMMMRGRPAGESTDAREIQRMKAEIDLLRSERQSEYPQERLP